MKNNEHVPNDVREKRPHSIQGRRSRWPKVGARGRVFARILQREARAHNRSGRRAAARAEQNKTTAQRLLLRSH